MSLTTVYLVCAIGGGAILILRLILMLIGLDHGDMGDIGVDVDAGIGGHMGDGFGNVFNFLSIQSIAGFFTMFGLVGLGLLEVNASAIWSLAGALTAGLITAWATSMIFMLMGRLQSDGTLHIENAIGQQGTVYLTIPEKGTGVVTIAVQGTQRTMDAISESGQKIPTGSLITVKRITAGNILVVSEQLSSDA